MSYPPEAWERLGRLLITRRVQIDPVFRNRQKFIAATGLHERLVSDLEKGRRFSYRPATIDAVEAAYGLIPGTFDRSLQEGVLLVAHKGPASPQSDSPPAAEDDSSLATEYEFDWYRTLSGEPALTFDKRPLPPKLKGLDLPATFDPTSYPQSEVHVWLTPGLTVDQRASLVAMVRRWQDEAEGAGEVLREVNGDD